MPMPKINVEHTSSVPAAELYEKVKSFFGTSEDIRRLDPKIACEFEDSTMSGKATGSQFKGNFAITSQGTGSKVTVVVDLPLLLTPFKGKIQETIERKLAKYVG